MTKLAEILKEKGGRIAVLETSAGGRISSMLIEEPGASDYFLGGFVAYNNDMKTYLLGEPFMKTLKSGIVSAEFVGSAADRMAQMPTRVPSFMIGIAESGIAPPQNEEARSKKPVGSFYVGVCIQTPGGSMRSLTKGFISAETTRERYMEQVAVTAIKFATVNLEEVYRNWKDIT